MTEPTFFDDDYARLLAPFHSEARTRREVGALHELIGLAQDERILDLGCGWGRHLRLLRAAGHDVTGVDRSLPLLRRVRSAPPAPLAAADMRSLPFRDHGFDVVLNLATSLGLHLEDDPAVAALAEARRVLRPGGRLLVEGMHREDVIAHFSPRDRWTLEDGTEVRARRRLDQGTGISHEVLRWERPHGPTLSKRHSLRLRSADELAALLDRAGLRVRDRWGDWSGESFRPSSPRLILLAVRPGA